MEIHALVRMEKEVSGDNLEAPGKVRRLGVDKWLKGLRSVRGTMQPRSFASKAWLAGFWKMNAPRGLARPSVNFPGGLMISPR